MPKRKLEDLLKLKDSNPTNPAKQAVKQPGSRTANISGKPNPQAQLDRPSKRQKRIKRPSGPVDVSKELSSLSHPASENKKLPKLPSNTTVSKRPINHGPIASRFAGSNVPKVVYVSRRTPLISAVKRVKQFLREIEKRALQSAGVDGALNRAASGRNGDGDLQRKLTEVSEKLGSDGEEVLVKASGRAMEQALRVAEWFRNREDEMLCKVEVRTGSVSVIDDIVEVDPEDTAAADEEGQDEVEDGEGQEVTTVLEGGDTTMELLANLDTNSEEKATLASGEQAKGVQAEEAKGDQASESKRKRRKRKKKEYDPDDIPEARLRWVKTIEIAISLQA